jgi:hypothetical protein
MCTLSPLDWLTIVDIIGIKTLLQLETLKTEVEVAGGCLKQYIGLAKSVMSFPFGDEEAAGNI